MPPSNRMTLNNKSYGIAGDSLIPSGKRAISRRWRATNGTDPGRIRMVAWNPATPIGHSHHPGPDLQTDYTQNLATDVLDTLTSVGARNALTLTSADPLASNSANFGGPKFGASATKFGGAVASQDVTHIAEQGGYLLFFRGAVVTQVRISDWTVLNSHTFDATVKGAANWFLKVRAGLGGTKAIQTLTGLSDSAMTWADTQVSGSDIYGKAMAVGNDRLLFVEGDPAGTNENKIRYTTDDFATAGNRFQVGDPKQNATGVGAWGPFTHVGNRSGIYTFTDIGKSFPLSTALRGTLDDRNGSQFADPGWGYNAAISSLGLRAVTGSTDDPIGIGEAMPEFDGHDGVPQAIFAYAGQLIVVYQTSAGHVYGYRVSHTTRGHVSGASADEVGFNMYPLFYIASTDVKSVYATYTPTNPTLVFANGTNAFYITQGRSAHYELDSNYTYSTGGGTWFGTTYEGNPHLLKTIRLFRFRTTNMESGDSWTLAVSRDDAAYVNIGSSVTSSGYQTLRPVSSGTPQTNISGRTIKPRLTQVAGGATSSTAPPSIEGMIEMEYDERPEEVEEVTVYVDLTAEKRAGQLEELVDLSGSSTDGPVAVRLPDDTGTKYCMVAGVNEVVDVKNAESRGAAVTLHIWETA